MRMLPMNEEQSVPEEVNIHEDHTGIPINGEENISSGSSTLPLGEEIKTENKKIDENHLKKEMNRRFFVSILTGSAFAASGFAAWKWIINSEKVDEIPWLLRKNHEFNEKLSRAYSRPARMAPEFSNSKASEPRENGDIGLEYEIDLSEWSLQASGESGTKDITLDDIKALPVFEMVTELKCIEGWSTIVQWKGAKLFDFLMKNRLISSKSKYVSLETPDQEYYVGLDIESAIHPQTLLAYEMNGEPLTQAHGAPLRLVTPLKYGIKHIKRIGTIKVTDQKPRDYWAERGYDWYSGH
jgi:hypothetical protein